ncbi:glycoside hydrolase [Podospora aff. communis PSN243]|uniref:mannan endo-1,4-beta-mannosidase n=1 Tax=Podospora aff. communis PSN243 TaxID=3040156 RepID=A0AAV9GP77_9PEZI|nr:glycoside hydrolase [Podospora aff. communis PSN243]
MADKDTRDVPVTRSGSVLYLDGSPWRAVGPNVYWLGLDENVIPPAGEPFYAPLNASYPTRERVTEMMAVSEAAFDAIDWAVYQARMYGLRLMVPLTDNFDYYHGGKYDFLRWNGFNLSRARDERNPAVQNFYTNSKVVAAFKEYISILLTHINPLTNLTYAEDPTIFAYETGNELCGPVWKDQDVPVEWIQEIGRHVKKLAPQKLFVDGTYGVNKSHLVIDEVDIYSNHYYPISINVLRQDLALVRSANKSYFAGEYGWNRASSTTDDDLASWFREIERSPAIMGDAFWSLFGRDSPGACHKFVEHADGFTMQYGNPAHEVRIQLVRQHFVKMSQGISIGAHAALPAVPCLAALAPAPDS